MRGVIRIFCAVVLVVTVLSIGMNAAGSNSEWKKIDPPKRSTAERVDKDDINDAASLESIPEMNPQNKLYDPVAAEEYEERLLANCDSLDSDDDEYDDEEYDLSAVRPDKRWRSIGAPKAKSTRSSKPMPQTKPKIKPELKPKSKKDKKMAGKKKKKRKRRVTPKAKAAGWTKSVQEVDVKGVKFKMVRVDGGTFKMGSVDADAYSDEKPMVSQTIKTFYIGQTEVTQALWEAVMGENPSTFKGADYPVENVSWEDCQEFVYRLNCLTGLIFRLPSEAEWEFAARGGRRSQSYTYSGSNRLNRVGWFNDNGEDKTHPVASKLDSELGLYDMCGNVREWTGDLESADYSSPRKGTKRVSRGGSYGADARSCRSTVRFPTHPDDSYSYLGMRLAL